VKNLAASSDQIESTVVSSIEGLPVIGLIKVKTLLAGDAMLLLELTYAAGAASQPHRHDHESHCYLVSGRMRAVVAGEAWDVGPGDACIHPAGVLHAMTAVEDSVVVEIKSPRPDPERFLS
jgi:quercetin dioxygenase-like cupin family protein